LFQKGKGNFNKLKLVS